MYSVNELFTEYLFSSWFWIEKEPLRAFAIDHFCRRSQQDFKTLKRSTFFFDNINDF
jgi:hypothetical protein